MHAAAYLALAEAAGGKREQAREWLNTLDKLQTDLHRENQELIGLVSETWKILRDQDSKANQKK
jgi:hypothetical protein